MATITSTPARLVQTTAAVRTLTRPATAAVSDQAIAKGFQQDSRTFRLGAHLEQLPFQQIHTISGTPLKGATNQTIYTSTTTTRVTYLSHRELQH